MNPFAFTAAVSYLLGSIPFGFILVRAFRGEDVRNTGSGNIGATNVARSYPALGMLTLFLDALKGSAAVALSMRLFPDRPILAAAAALFAVVGHVFPVWLNFRGGKGVATGFGAFVLLAPKSVLVMVGIFAVLVFLFRYVSLASIIVVILFPLLAWQLDGHHKLPQVFALMAAASLLIVLKHHGNVRRLIAGTESRFALRREQMADK